MIHSVVLAVGFYFLLAPALTLFHEFGHAVVPLAKGEAVEISVGGFEGRSFKIGNLQITYASPWKPWIGMTSGNGVESIWSSAMGPLASALIAVSAFISSFSVVGYLWMGTFSVSIYRNTHEVFRVGGIWIRDEK